jgi:gliding motility-associated-like protein
MLRKILQVFFLLLICYTKSKGQACTTLGQTPATAFPVCGIDVFHQTSVPTCTNGVIPVGCTDGISYADLNPYWYEFTCYVTGTLGLLITPENRDDDYDWQLFDITGHSSTEVYTNPALFVVGNWSGSSGNTGTSASNSNALSCASDPNANVTTFSKMPVITEGHQYLLMISHFSGDNQSGYGLSFGGGTGSIVDPLKPKMNTATADCSGTKIYVGFNKQLQCKTLSSNGSEFQLSPPLANVIAASGVNCDNSFDMDSVLLTLDKPLLAGSYNLSIKNGSDSNTLLDNCGNYVADSSVAFTIIPLAPTPMDSLKPVQCAPDILQLVFKDGIRCNSVAANGSDFVVTGNVPVTVSSAYADSCNAGLLNIIKIKLSKPVQTAGNFTITLKNGSDGNTILNDCAQETPAGSSLNFSTADTVSAAFAYTVKLGCVYDTFFYAHDGRNGVNEWEWTFDTNGTSTMQNSFFLFHSYGNKHIKLNVSNGMCTDSSSADILLDNELISRFTIKPSPELCPEDVAQFTDSSTGKIVSWYWNFGDGITSTIQNPPPKYYPAPSTRDGKTYPAALIVKNDIGCYDTARQNIKVLYNCYIAVPSAFTPNGDGLNDYLYPLDAYKAENLQFRVYNRWGQLVYQTKDWTKKWDGRINGYPQAPGTYVWMLSYVNRDTGKSFALKGTTVLIR